MAAKGVIKEMGVIDHEQILADKFLRQWAMRGIRLVKQVRYGKPQRNSVTSFAF